MKIRLTKDFKKPNGLTIDKGRFMVVTQELGQQLIRQKKAVEDGEKEEVIINFETKEDKLLT
mgnify:CR=1 FL=1